jgi:mRNA interferase RelE/StbE
LEVKFTRKFLKELSSLPKGQRIKVEHFVFEEAPAYKSLAEIPKFEKLKGYKHFYKKRFGDFRVGMRFENDMLYFERVLHRKDIYRYFP